MQTNKKRVTGSPFVAKMEFEDGLREILDFLKKKA